MSSQVNAFSKNAITQFGLSEKSAKQFMGTFGAMSKSFGFSEESAYEMSKTVTGLVGDVASFYNISQDLASVKLKAIWTGETEGLKDLGVVMTQTALQEYALQKGINKTISEMSEAEKVALRYYFVQDKLAVATGDFARTSDGWANQTRVLSLRFEQLKATLGQGFITLFTPIIKGINTILAGLQKVADVFTAVINKIFGKQAEQVSSISTEYEALGSSAIDSANDVVSASKKAQKAIMCYDKLNILSNKKDTGKSSSSGGNSVPTIPSIGSPEIIDNTSPQMQGTIDKIISYIEPLKSISFENLSNSFQNLWDSLGFLKDGTLGLLDNFYFKYLVPMASYTIKDFLPRFFNSTANAIKKIDFPKIQSALEKLWEALVPFKQNVGNGLLWLYEKALLPLSTWVINDVLPSFLEILTGALDILNQAISDMQPIFEWFWENVLQPLADWTGGVIVDILNGIGDALKWIADNEIAMAILEGLAIAIGGVSVAIAIYNGVMAVCNIVTGIFSGIMAVLTSPITLVIGAISLLVAGILLLIKHWDKVKEVAENVWDGIKNIWGSVCEWFTTTVIEPISNFFSGMWDGLKNGALSAWEGIKNIFSNVASFFKNIFTNAWNEVKAVFSVGGKIFDGIKDGIVNAFTTVVNAIIRGINKVVSVPFNGINSALGKIKGIDILGYKPFNWINTIKVPQIPELAEGAWFKARNPQLAIVGEGKSNEIVAPEPKLDDAIDRGFKKHGGNGGTQKIEMTIYVVYEDGKRIIKKINDTQIQEGKILLEI